MKAKQDFLWYKQGAEISADETEENIANWKAQDLIEGSDVKSKSSETKNPLDLNNDGVVDKKDASIAGKVMASARKSKGSKKK